jgi:hypothetical protein
MAFEIQIRSSKQLGQVIKAARKWQHLRQDEVGTASHSFILDLEMGKPTAQVGKTLEALRQLGIRLHLELPPGMPIPALLTSEDSQ